MLRSASPLMMPYGYQSSLKSSPDSSRASASPSSSTTIFSRSSGSSNPPTFLLDNYNSSNMGEDDYLDENMFQIPPFLAPSAADTPATYQGAVALGSNSMFSQSQAQSSSGGGGFNLGRTSSSTSRYPSQQMGISPAVPPMSIPPSAGGALDDGQPRSSRNTTSINNIALVPLPPSMMAPSLTYPSHHPHAHPHHHPPHPPQSLHVAQPTQSSGLPLYSATGFDIVSILTRVAMRPRPTVRLGPIDMTCAFTVVDVRRHDHPIVYCSPSFCELTRYAENEVIGRNCRFLQAPNGIVNIGDEKTYTNTDGVMHLRKSLAADKECQANLINYRKGGEPFINHITIIPITGGSKGEGYEPDDVVYHIGFQVDLNHQPNEILKRLQMGTYRSGDAAEVVLPVLKQTAGGVGGVVGMGEAAAAGMGMRGRKTHTMGNEMMSKSLRTLLADPAFLSAVSPSSSSTSGSSSASSSTSLLTAPDKDSHPLSTLLLETLPHDPIIVVSLKGAFLYVAPTIKGLLGYDAQELVGKSLTDVCHPADVAPLVRELKDSSTVSSAGGPGSNSRSPTSSSGGRNSGGAGASGGGPGSGSGNGNTIGSGSDGMGSNPTFSGTTASGSGSGASSSGTNPNAASSSSSHRHNPNQNANTTPGLPRPVDLLFRARDKWNRYTWMECRGRLFLEPGKSRKAIILTARTREFVRLPLGAVVVPPAVPIASSSSPSQHQHQQHAQASTSSSSATEPITGERRNKDAWYWRKEVWGTLSTLGGTILSIGENASEVLGWHVSELVGRRVVDFVFPDHGSGGGGSSGAPGGGTQRGRMVMDALDAVSGRREGRVEKRKSVEVRFERKGNGGGWVDLKMVLYRPEGLYFPPPPPGSSSTMGGGGNGAGCHTVFFQLYPAPVEARGGHGQGQGQMQMHRHHQSQHQHHRQGHGPQILPYQFGQHTSHQHASSSSSLLPPPPPGPSSSSQFEFYAPISSQGTVTSGDIFDELSVQGKTSWQYELQQMKIENLRLEEEIRALEGDIQGGGGVSAGSGGGGGGEGVLS